MVSLLKDMVIDTDPANLHPVTARFERLDAGHEGEVETVRARDAIGCDGARSTVRRSLGRELKGDSANQAWGVMEVLAVTDYPDIRLKGVIQSANEGSIVLRRVRHVDRTGRH
jgi:phenol 2-monooxygenase